MFKNADGRAFNEVAVLFYTGMHVKIYCNPQKYGVDWDGGILSWLRTKKEGRKALIRIPVPKRGFPSLLSVNEVRREIDRWLKTPEWERVTRQQVWRDLRALGKKANVRKDLSPAHGRHTFCLWDLEAENGNMMVVKQDMGCSMKMIIENYGLLESRRYD